jgi:hypothetical protein
MDTEMALRFTLDSFDQREALRTDLARTNVQVHALLDAYCDRLADFFGKVAR